MTREVISTGNAPKAIGPYSQAISAKGNYIFISEQIPLAPDGKIIGEEIKEQTRQVIENIENILRSAGASLEDVVKVSVFLKNLEDFTKMNEVYSEYFSESKPARTAFEVSKIPKDVLIGMEAIAVIE